MGNIFKAYDIRGVYPGEINEKLAYAIGQAVASFLNEKEIVVCKDIRLSSEALFRALASGINDAGADVIDVGYGTTPMCYFANFFYGYKASIGITASHNPKEYNGFKICKANAVPLSYESGLNEIEKLLRENKVRRGSSKGTIKKKDILGDYVNYMSKFVKVNRKICVVVDASNGAAGTSIFKIFNDVKNVDLIPLYFEPDGSFPNHSPNPMEKGAVDELKKTVIARKADFGAIMDCDADRVFFVDETGGDVRGDYVTALIAREMLKAKLGQRILYDLRSSRIVRETVEKFGGSAEMCRVGHAYIKQEMRQKNAVFAGELSGHYYYKDISYTDSGLLTLIKIINFVSLQDKKLSEIMHAMDKYYHTGEINFTVRDQEGVMNRIEEAYSDGRISHLDGILVEYDDWWFNLRKSNTEPLIRLTLEAIHKDNMEDRKKEISKLIKEIG